MPTQEAGRLEPSRNGLVVQFSQKHLDWLGTVIDDAVAVYEDMSTDPDVRQEDFPAQLLARGEQAWETFGRAVAVTSPPLTDDGDALIVQVAVIQGELQFNVREWYNPAGAGPSAGGRKRKAARHAG
jgi:hypothetical protein